MDKRGNNFEQLYNAVAGWARAYQISVNEAPLPSDKAGNFDGISITINPHFSLGRAQLTILCMRWAASCFGLRTWMECRNYLTT